jgi:hypothetical protein
MFGGDVFAKRNDAKYWSGWVKGDGPTRTLKVTAVSFDEQGLELVIEDNGTEIKLAAVPTDTSHTKVLLNDELVEGAAMVFAPKPSLFNLTRYAFDFRPIPLGGKTLRFETRYDP